MIYIEHIAGDWDTDTKLQICVMCGCVLNDTSKSTFKHSLKLNAGMKFITDNFNTGLVEKSCIDENDVIEPCHLKGKMDLLNRKIRRR